MHCPVNSRESLLLYHYALPIIYNYNFIKSANVKLKCVVNAHTHLLFSPGATSLAVLDEIFILSLANDDWLCP